MKRLSQALLVAACFATLSASASAATKTETSNSNIIAIQDTDWNDFLTFAKFNSSLGTLQSVKVDLYSTITGSVSLTNNNDGPESATVPLDLGATVALTRPDSTSLALINGTLFHTSVSIAPGDTYSNNKTLVLHSDGSFSSPSDLALFTGPGSIATLIAANAWSSTGGDGIDAQFATQASGKGTVTYTYLAAAVPEPETYAMLLLGLGMLGVVAKRKRANVA